MAKLTDFISEDEIAEHFEESAEILQYKMLVAQQAVEYAKSIAPVDTGAYRDSIKVERRGSKVRVVWKDYKSHWIEYGTEDTPEYAIRAKTIEHFGGDIR